MYRSLVTKTALFAAALVGTLALAERAAEAGCNRCGNNTCIECRNREYGQPDLFYNYYVPGTCGGVGSQMYLAPQPVPAVVGHTYYTYQPFMPHESLYPHHRRYYRYYNDGRGMTRTSVHWYRPPVVTTMQGIRSPFKIAR